jgi:hypothetical protein
MNNNEVFYNVYLILSNQLPSLVKFLLYIIAFAGYLNALTVFIMYAFNKINLSSNRIFWRSILIPGYILFKKHNLTEEKHI